MARTTAGQARIGSGTRGLAAVSVPAGSGRRAALAATLLLAACDAADRRQSDGPATKESGDVAVVENGALGADAGPGWSVGPAPVWAVGTAAGAAVDQLYGVRDATVLPGGRVAVANAGTGEVRVYAPDGTHVVSMGGPGEGPGEFRALRSVHAWAGDSILAWDVRQQRITVFDASGAHGRTTRIRDFDDTLSPELLDVTGDGRLLVRSGFPHQESREPGRGMFRPLLRYALVDGDGQARAELGEHPGEEGFLVTGGGFETFGAHPHGKSTYAAVWGGEVLISPNDTFQLKTFSLDGRPARIVRLDEPARVPTRQDMEDWFEAYTAEDAPEDRAAFRREFDALPLLETMPAFDAVQVDALGHVWVRTYTGAGDALSGARSSEGQGPAWVVFDPDGRALGRVRTPAGLEIYEIGADYLLGRARDALGVEYVQMWGLER